MPAPLSEVVAAVREIAAFGRMYADVRQFMAVRGHIPYPPAAETEAWRRRVALAQEGADLLASAHGALGDDPKPLTRRQD